MRKLERRISTTVELDGDDVAECRRHDEAGADVDQRDADDAVAPDHLELVVAERAQEQRVGAAVEIGEVVGEVDDPGGIAMPPLDRHLVAVDEHAQRGASRTPPSSRITSPLR